MPDPGIAELLQALGSQEPQPAWNSFLQTFSVSICEVVRWFERDADDAEDCFLYVCEQLSRKQFRRLRRFDPHGRASFLTWLRAVVRNLCLDWHRSRFGRYRVFQSVARLSDLDQQVFRYVCEQGFSAEQCTEALNPRFSGISTEQVEHSLQRLRNTLAPREMEQLDARRRRALLMNSGGLGEAGCQEPIDPAPDPEIQVAVQEGWDDVQRALARLAAPDRLLLLLRFDQELTLAQVARVLGLKDPQTADRRIREVLARVREYLGVHPEAGGKRLAKSV
jgi:RNA polymerase sigma factor (sigma-70 family)